MKQILLSMGKIAIVDDCDYERLNEHKWHYHNEGYAARNTHRPFRKIVLMHREILGAKAGEQIDHKNGNGLDNRRSNLRICTDAENKRNRPVYANSKSGVKGVWFCQKANKWEAAIKINGQRIWLGYFDTCIDAKAARDSRARELHKEFFHK